MQARGVYTANKKSSDEPGALSLSPQYGIAGSEPAGARGTLITFVVCQNVSEWSGTDNTLLPTDRVILNFQKGKFDRF